MFGGLFDSLKKSNSIFGSSSRSSFSSNNNNAASPAVVPSATAPAAVTQQSGSSSPSLLALASPTPPTPAALAPFIHTHLTLGDSAALQFMSHLECVMCSAIMWSPVKTPCLHMFCHDCIVPWVNKSGTCPTCRKEVAVVNLVKLEQGGDMLWQTFLTLQVRCVFADEGADSCSWKGNYSDLLSHLQLHCPAAPVTCPGEPTSFPRKHWTTHQSSCVSLPCECEYCSLPLLRSDLPEHQDTVCLGIPVPCPNGCKENEAVVNIPRGELASHREKCPKENVPCPLGPRCPAPNEQVARENLRVHVNDADGSHMMQLFGLVQDLTQQVSHLSLELEAERKSRKCDRPYAARVWFCDTGAWVKPSPSSQMPNTMVGVIIGPGRNEGWVRVNWVDGAASDGCRVGGGDSELVYTTPPETSLSSRGTIQAATTTTSSSSSSPSSTTTSTSTASASASSTTTTAATTAAASSAPSSSPSRSLHLKVGEFKDASY